MKMRQGFIFLAVVLFGSLTASNARALPQSKNATLTGVVLGPDDKPVPHANVAYQSSSGSAAHVIHADAHGRFSITKLRADNYDMRASSKGIFSAWEKNVNLRPGQTKTITLQLIYAKEMPKTVASEKK